ncbi:MAG TPA: ABC transporter permease [Fimbriimonadaceae bacterium]|nr:ABC transporter permease [Fimbriimonadaceae bacterium]
MSATWKVFKKESKEMFRDKRVRTSAFLMPILLIVGMLYMFGIVIGSVSRPQNQRIHVLQPDHPLVEVLRRAQFDIRPVAGLAEAQRLVSEGRARLVLNFHQNQQGQFEVAAYFDPKQQMGQIALARVRQVFEHANREALRKVLADRGIPLAAMEAIQVGEREVKVGVGRGAGEMIVGILPYLIVIWAFYGGFGVASDLVAGEKEKSTLETLLITPVRRTEIVLGKFFALALVCLLSALSSLVGLALYATVKPQGSELLLKGGMGVSPMAALVIFLVLLPTVALFASLLVAISSYAKNTREAQTHLGLVSFIVLMPAIASQFIGLTDMANSTWVHFVPVLNTANTIRGALMGTYNWAGIFATMGVSLVLALVSIRIAIWLFNREQVLVRV